MNTTQRTPMTSPTPAQIRATMADTVDQSIDDYVERHTRTLDITSRTLVDAVRAEFGTLDDDTVDLCLDIAAEFSRYSE